jgi:predicted nuclease with TOPRIM domain
MSFWKMFNCAKQSTESQPLRLEQDTNLANVKAQNTELQRSLATVEDKYQVLVKDFIGLENRFELLENDYVNLDKDYKNLENNYDEVTNKCELLEASLAESRDLICSKDVTSQTLVRPLLRLLHQSAIAKKDFESKEIIEEIAVLLEYLKRASF